MRIGVMVLPLTLAFAASVKAQTVPNFYARHDYSNLFSQSFAVGDFNGDGIRDIVADDTGNLTVLFGTGDGSFRNGPASTLNALFPLRAADLNRDGRADLIFVSINNNVGGVTLCLGNGDGTFRSGTFYPAGADDGGSIGNVLVGEFNGDGRADIVQVGASGIWLFAGKGDGTLKPGVLAASLPVGGTRLVEDDFNQDGKLDLVVAMYDIYSNNGIGDGIYVLFGNGDGTFQTPQHFAHPNRPASLAAGKLGPGGHLSFAATGPNNTVVIYFGDGNGGFSTPRYVTGIPSAGFDTLAIGDVNGDGIWDLISGSAEAYVFFGTSTGGFTKAGAYPIESGGGLFSVGVSDLRKDGRIDIITDSAQGISVLLNQAKGTFTDGIFPKLPVSAGCGVSGDFNGDGKPDLAVNTSQGITILLGTGQTFSPFIVGTSMTLANAQCLTTAGDLNNDGILDLTISTPTSVVSYLGKGDGTFTMKSSTPTNFAQFMVLADFNRDGILDFATSGDLMAYGNGDGTFQTPHQFVANPIPYPYSNIAVGDVNNDGWPDLILTNFNIPIYPLYVGLNNQHGGFITVPETGTFGGETDEIALADLNGDGYLDMLLTDGVYLGDGTGNFVLKQGLDFSNQGGTDFGMISDLNGDGIPDIVIVGSQDIEINLGKGDGTYATPYFLGAGPGPGWALPANLHGQNPAAGTPDLVLPDQSGGVMVLPNLTK